MRNGVTEYRSNGVLENGRNSIEPSIDVTSQDRAQGRFKNLSPLSLTPRFSGVPECARAIINCFNSFRGRNSAYCRLDRYSTTPPLQYSIFSL